MQIIMIVTAYKVNVTLLNPSYCMLKNAFMILNTFAFIADEKICFYPLCVVVARLLSLFARLPVVLSVVLRFKQIDFHS